MDSKKYKALIVDFDNTLVDATFKLSPKLKNEIEELIKKGFVFSIATGRPYPGIVKTICQDLKLKSPQIVSGGSEIVDPVMDKVIWTEYFPKESAKNLINYFLSKDFDFSAESEGCVFTKNGKDRSDVYGPNTLFKDVEKIDYQNISKMILFHVSPMGNPKEIEDDLNQKFPDIHFIRSGRGGTVVLDITSKKANKHLAVLQLSKILNLDPSLIIGVGDGYNDYPLFEICGFRVAMENAPEGLKEKANLIVPDITNDGLSVLINKLLN